MFCRFSWVWGDIEPISPPPEALRSFKCLKSVLVYNNYLQLGSQYQPLCTLISATSFSSENILQVFKYWQACSDIFFYFSLHSSWISPLSNWYLLPPLCTYILLQLLLSSYTSWNWYRVISSAVSQLPYLITQDLKWCFTSRKHTAHMCTSESSWINRATMCATEHAIHPPNGSVPTLSQN